MRRTPLASSPSLPFLRSYWVVPGLLLAGPYPGHLQPDEAAARLRALVGCGIRQVINLMEPDEVNHQGQPFVPYLETMQACVTRPGERVAMDRFPIRDMSIPSRSTMKRILDKMDASIAAGVPVYLHCWGGVGRTGTVVGCYLVRHRLAMPGQAALDQIAALRRHILPARSSPETDEQRHFVRSWKPGE